MLLCLCSMIAVTSLCGIQKILRMWSVHENAVIRWGTPSISRISSATKGELLPGRWQSWTIQRITLENRKGKCRTEMTNKQLRMPSSHLISSSLAISVRFFTAWIWPPASGWKECKCCFDTCVVNVRCRGNDILFRIFIRASRTLRSSECDSDSSLEQRSETGRVK